jgi:tRNA dimethylallyltransferase
MPRPAAADLPPFLVGPTGVGKTAVAIPLARALGAEILSIDSRQAYRRLDIGTAKPTAAERAAAPHHLLDLFEPGEVASAAVFARHFNAALAELRARGRGALAVGGSGLYVDACLGRLDRLPPADPAIRATHRRIRDEQGAARLHEVLRAVDPETAARLAPADFQRVSRALEVHDTTGLPLSRLQTRRGPLDLTGGPAMILLLRDRADLRRRIAARAHAMIETGLLEELAALLASGIAPDAPGLQAIGYTDFVGVLRGEVAREAAVDAFIARTVAYAKRQTTWFRNRYLGVRVVEAGEETPEETAGRVRRLLTGAPGAP